MDRRIQMSCDNGKCKGLCNLRGFRSSTNRKDRRRASIEGNIDVSGAERKYVLRVDYDYDGSEICDLGLGEEVINALTSALSVCPQLAKWNYLSEILEELRPAYPDIAAGLVEASRLQGSAAAATGQENSNVGRAGSNCDGISLKQESIMLHIIMQDGQGGSPRVTNLMLTPDESGQFHPSTELEEEQPINRTTPYLSVASAHGNDVSSLHVDSTRPRSLSVGSDTATGTTAQSSVSWSNFQNDRDYEDHVQPFQVGHGISPTRSTSPAPHQISVVVESSRDTPSQSKSRTCERRTVPIAEPEKPKCSFVDPCKDGPHSNKPDVCVSVPVRYPGTRDYGLEPRPMVLTNWRPFVLTPKSEVECPPGYAMGTLSATRRTMCPPKTGSHCKQTPSNSIMDSIIGLRRGSFAAARCEQASRMSGSGGTEGCPRMDSATTDRRAACPRKTGEPSTRAAEPSTAPPQGNRKRKLTGYVPYSPEPENDFDADTRRSAASPSMRVKSVIIDGLEYGSSQSSAANAGFERNSLCSQPRPTSPSLNKCGSTINPSTFVRNSESPFMAAPSTNQRCFSSVSSPPLRNCDSVITPSPSVRFSEAPFTHSPSMKESCATIGPIAGAPSMRNCDSVITPSPSVRFSEAPFAHSPSMKESCATIGPIAGAPSMRNCDSVITPSPSMRFSEAPFAHSPSMKESCASIGPISGTPSMRNCDSVISPASSMRMKSSFMHSPSMKQSCVGVAPSMIQPSPSVTLTGVNDESVALSRSSSVLSKQKSPSIACEQLGGSMSSMQVEIADCGPQASQYPRSSTPLQNLQSHVVSLGQPEIGRSLYAESPSNASICDQSYMNPAIYSPSVLMQPHSSGVICDQRPTWVLSQPPQSVYGRPSMAPNREAGGLAFTEQAPSRAFHIPSQVGLSICPQISRIYSPSIPLMEPGSIRPMTQVNAGVLSAYPPQMLNGGSFFAPASATDSCGGLGQGQFVHQSFSQGTQMPTPPRCGPSIRATGSNGNPKSVSVKGSLYTNGQTFRLSSTDRGTSFSNCSRERASNTPGSLRPPSIVVDEHHQGSEIDAELMENVGVQCTPQALDSFDKNNGSVVKEEDEEACQKVSWDASVRSNGLTVCEAGSHCKNMIVCNYSQAELNASKLFTSVNNGVSVENCCAQSFPETHHRQGSVIRTGQQAKKSLLNRDSYVISSRMLASTQQSPSTLERRQSFNCLSEPLYSSQLGTANISFSASCDHSPFEDFSQAMGPSLNPCNPVTEAMIKRACSVIESDALLDSQVSSEYTDISEQKPGPLDGGRRNSECQTNPRPPPPPPGTPKLTDGKLSRRPISSMMCANPPGSLNPLVYSASLASVVNGSLPLRSVFNISSSDPQIHDQQHSPNLPPINISPFAIITNPGFSQTSISVMPDPQMSYKTSSVNQAPSSMPMNIKYSSRSLCNAMSQVTEICHQQNSAELPAPISSASTMDMNAEYPLSSVYKMTSPIAQMCDLLPTINFLPSDRAVGAVNPQISSSDKLIPDPQIQDQHKCVQIPPINCSISGMPLDCRVLQSYLSNSMHQPNSLNSHAINLHPSSMVVNGGFASKMGMSEQQMCDQWQRVTSGNQVDGNISQIARSILMTPQEDICDQQATHLHQINSPPSAVPMNGTLLRGSGSNLMTPGLQMCDQQQTAHPSQINASLSSVTLPQRSVSSITPSETRIAEEDQARNHATYGNLKLANPFLNAGNQCFMCAPIMPFPSNLDQQPLCPLLFCCCDTITPVPGSEMYQQQQPSEPISPGVQQGSAWCQDPAIPLADATGCREDPHVAVMHEQSTQKQHDEDQEQHQEHQQQEQQQQQEVNLERQQQQQQPGDCSVPDVCSLPAWVRAVLATRVTHRGTSMDYCCCESDTTSVPQAPSNGESCETPMEDHRECSPLNLKFNICLPNPRKQDTICNSQEESLSYSVEVKPTTRPPRSILPRPSSDACAVQRCSTDRRNFSEENVGECCDGHENSPSLRNSFQSLNRGRCFGSTPKRNLYQPSSINRCTSDNMRGSMRNRRHSGCSDNEEEVGWLPIQFQSGGRSSNAGNKKQNTYQINICDTLCQPVNPGMQTCGGLRCPKTISGDTCAGGRQISICSNCQKRKTPCPSQQLAATRVETASTPPLPPPPQAPRRKPRSSWTESANSLSAGAVRHMGMHDVMVIFPPEDLRPDQLPDDEDCECMPFHNSAAGSHKVARKSAVEAGCCTYVSRRKCPKPEPKNWCGPPTILLNQSTFTSESREKKLISGRVVKRHPCAKAMACPQKRAQPIK